MDYTEDNCLAYRLFRTTGYEEGTPGTLRWLHHCTTAVWKIQQRLTWAMQSWDRTCHIVREQWNTWSRFAVPLSVLSSSPLPLLSLSNQTLQSVCIQCLPTGSLGSSTKCLSASLGLTSLQTGSAIRESNFRSQHVKIWRSFHEVMRKHWTYIDIKWILVKLNLGVAYSQKTENRHAREDLWDILRCWSKSDHYEIQKLSELKECH